MVIEHRDSVADAVIEAPFASPPERYLNDIWTP
jgi:hypothetical protein